MDIVSLIISLISGAAGGNVAGAALPDKNLGALGNTIAGLIGGGAGAAILKALGVLASSGAAAGTAAAGTAAAGTGTELDLASILANVAASGVGGGALTAIIAFIKEAMAKK